MNTNRDYDELEEWGDLKLWYNKLVPARKPTETTQYGDLIHELAVGYEENPTRELREQGLSLVTDYMATLRKREAETPQFLSQLEQKLQNLFPEQD